ncbi:MAG: ribosome-associated translation inhibitor RaiA [Oscillospiraceae bacterium]|nr:ribosome-associated translation inhibitor RaiA [Oscillospiraceae bacterium]
MKITITGRKVNLRDSFKERVNKKLAKFDKFFGDDAEANVTVTLEKNRYSIELTIRSNSYIYRVEHTSVDLDEALDIIVEKISRQIRKNKTKIERRHRAATPLNFDYIYDKDDYSEEENYEEPDYQVVRTKKFPIKPMDVEEAILQMNLIGHQFFMFLNVDTSEINVVYARKDGNYGLLEPENR